MTRYEYRTISQHDTNVGDVTKEINAFGREGFRVVQFKVGRNVNNSHTLWVLLERPYETEDEP